MALDFPSPATVGQLFPTSPAPGAPQFRWDGTAWSSTGTSMTGAVRYDAPQALTVPQLVQARSNVYAAPFDALAYNGMQVNGNMEVSQANGTTAVTSGYVVDGWVVTPMGPLVSCQQVTDAPPGYTNSLKVSITTADPSPAAGDVINILQRFEGLRIARLAFGTPSASPISIGFWVKANRPGSYSGSCLNNSQTRTYVFTFTVSTSATWQYITVTIPGDVTGTWTTDNTLGITVRFCMMAGASQQTTPGVWIAGGPFGGATGTINGAAATTDYMQITGVVVLPGIELPSAARAPFIMRPFDQEMMLCKRYFEICSATLQSPAASTLIVPYTFNVGKRVSPTMTTVTAPTLSNATVSFNSVFPTSVALQLSATAVAAYATGWAFSADARL